LRGIEKHLSEFEARGIRVAAISVDPPNVSRNLATKRGYTYTILSDPRAEVIRRYDLLHAGAGGGGQDIARPAEFLLDSRGVVRWVNLTEDFWVRATPEQMLEAAKQIE
jgi:peroxiredoxin